LTAESGWTGLSLALPLWAPGAALTDAGEMIRSTAMTPGG